MKPRVSAQETKDSKPLAEKSVGVVAARETPSLTGWFTEDPTGS